MTSAVGLLPATVNRAVKADAIAPPLRGFGLDGLTPSRVGLPVQVKADWERSRFQSGMERQRSALAKNATKLNKI
jgi:hypothetical protein